MDSKKGKQGEGGEGLGRVRLVSRARMNMPVNGLWEGRVGVSLSVRRWKTDLLMGFLSAPGTVGIEQGFHVFYVEGKLVHDVGRHPCKCNIG